VSEHEAAPIVYDYVDYRAFVRDAYTARKRDDRRFSLRWFARRAGLASWSFPKLVMEGKRNLGAANVEGFARALGLGGAEARFFGDLVTLAHAEAAAERQLALERISANRRFRQARKLEGAMLACLTHWYVPAVRELAARSDFVADPRWIARQLLPPIATAEAARALETLEEVGLLVRNEEGRLVRGEPTWTTGHELRASAVPAYHRQMLLRAAEAIDAVPPDEREMGAQTVCVRAASLPELKARLRQFRTEMLEHCESQTEPDRVYQLCLAFFPLTRAPTRRARSPGSRP
jgi:uncharacterized protein (TIGR02147 family)